jgi:hypothetical protein
MTDKFKLNFTQSNCIKCCVAVVTDRQKSMVKQVGALLQFFVETAPEIRIKDPG